MRTATGAEPDLQATADRWPAWSALVAGLLVVLALGGGLLLGRGMGDGSVRIDDAVSVGFAQDMKVHHAQAVEMSAIVHRRSPDPEVNYLALDILTTQQGQIGIMTGWLDLWGQTQSSRRPVMSWMDGHEGPMGGMATQEEVAALGSMSVAEMEEQYLRLMIRHHRGAVPMAGYAAERATSRDLARLAGGMAKGQASEIELMQDMLVARGYEVEQEGPGGHGGHGGHG